MAINDVEHCETCEIHEDKIKQVSEHMPDEDELYDLAELFKIFGDSTRIRILYVLFESEVCVCDLAEMLHIAHDAALFQLTFVLRQTAGGEIRAFFGGDHRCGGSLSRCNG